MSINYNSQDCEYKLKNKLKSTSLIKYCIDNEGFKTGPIAIIFCSDNYLLSINNQYLGHNYFTDVITFDYTESGIVSGDIFISIDTVADNAEVFEITPAQEMLRVMIHGILHLCGYGDKSPEEAVVMRDKENFYLDLFGKI